MDSRTEFHQTLVDNVDEGTDELNRFHREVTYLSELLLRAEAYTSMLNCKGVGVSSGCEWVE